jgi:hypothetical protein
MLLKHLSRKCFSPTITKQRMVCVRASLPSSDELNKRFEQLNKKDTEYEMVNYRNSLQNWPPSKDYQEIIQSCTNYNLLSDLDYIRVMRRLPILGYERVSLRYKLLQLFNDTNTTKNERRYIYAIMQYYKLLDD